VRWALEGCEYVIRLVDGFYEQVGLQGWRRRAIAWVGIMRVFINQRLTIIEVPEVHYITAGRIGVRLGVGSPAADISGELREKQMRTILTIQ
jgi:hypothetical protein